VIAVDLGGARIAETRRALRVLETSHPPAYYLPRADVAPPRPAPECGPDMVRVQGVGRVFRRGVPAGSAPRAPSKGGREAATGRRQVPPGSVPTGVRQDEASNTSCMPKRPTSSPLRDWSGGSAVGRMK
jgi:hypothetical protein